MYDDFGRLTVQRDARAKPTAYEYDNLDRRTKRTLPGGTYEAFVHDHSSPPLDPGVRVNKINKIQRRDFAGRFTVTTMDKSGRLESRLPDGQESGVTPLPTASQRGVSFTYTATGQRASMTEGPYQSRSTYYAYDGFGRLRVKQQPEGTVYYDYDAIGSLTEISARRSYPAYANPTWHVFQQDQTQPGPWDTGAARPNGAHMFFHYDELHRLSDVHRSGGELHSMVAKYHYDAAGNLASTDYGDYSPPFTSEYEYDARNHLRRLRTRTIETLPTAIASFDYDGVDSSAGFDWSGRTLTKAGLRRGVAELIRYGGTDHQRSIAYDYDGLNRLRAERIRTDADPAWPIFAPTTLPTTPADGDALYDVTPGYDGDPTGYDKVGNRRSRSSAGVANVTARAYDYDDNDRLTGSLANGTTAATYDANGNTLLANAGEDAAWDRTQPDEYDFENRLIVRKLASPVYTGGQRWIELLYDGDGNRVRKTIKDWDVGRDPTVTAVYDSPDQTTATRYLVDDRNLTGYAQVLEEQDAAGNPLVTYVYGLDLLTQTRNVGTVGSPNWQTHYFGYDGHGSVRYLVAAADGAVVTDTYTYDAFGVEIASPGTTLNNYRYCGEQWDADLGMYYLRARYLNPDSGRFWTRDSFEGSQSEPLSLHKYLYVHANPVDGIDPSGHMLDFLLGSFLSISTRAEWESARAPIYQRAITMALEVGFAAAADATLESYILSRIVDVREYLRQAKEIWRMRNPGQQLPKIVPIPAAIIPDVAMHVATHQRAVPADAVLTRAPVLLNIAHRAVTLATYGAAGTNLKGEKLSWDEYPLAASMEGGRPSSGPLPMPGFCSVWKVPLRQNILQGVIVGASYTLEKIAPGGKFEVVVIP